MFELLRTRNRVQTAQQYELSTARRTLSRIGYGPLVEIASPLCKWAVEVTRLGDLPRIVRQAATFALAPPTGTLARTRSGTRPAGGLDAGA